MIIPDDRLFDPERPPIAGPRHFQMSEAGENFVVALATHHEAGRIRTLEGVGQAIGHTIFGTLKAVRPAPGTPPTPEQYTQIVRDGEGAFMKEGQMGELDIRSRSALLRGLGRAYEAEMGVELELVPLVPADTVVNLRDAA